MAKEAYYQTAFGWWNLLLISATQKTEESRKGLVSKIQGKIP